MSLLLPRQGSPFDGIDALGAHQQQQVQMQPQQEGSVGVAPGNTPFYGSAPEGQQGFGGVQGGFIGDGQMVGLVGGAVGQEPFPYEVGKILTSQQ